MPEFYYSPHTGEVINTSTPADWMGKTHIAPPLFNPVNQGAFFREGAWVVETTVPKVIVPQSVTMRQARLALLGIGLLDQVDAVIAGIEDPTQRGAAEIEWEYAQTVDRNSPFVQQLSAGLGLTDEQKDQLFRTASQI